MAHYHKQKKRMFSSSKAASVFSGWFSPVVFLIFSLLLLFISSINSSILESTRTSASDFTYPLLSAISAPFNKVSDIAGEVTGVAELRAENAKLNEENKRLSLWYQSALNLKAENKSLKNLLNVKTPPNHKFITTRIYADAASPYVNSLLIAAGTDQGVKKAQAVLGENGIIGRIIEVGNKTSRILLINDMNSRIPVIIEGSNQRAILTGDNSKLLHLKYLPEDTIVDLGAKILTSGHGGVLPAGLLVGTVSNNHGNKVNVTPYTDLNTINYVKIINMPEIPGLIDRQNNGSLH